MVKIFQYVLETLRKIKLQMVHYHLMIKKTKAQGVLMTYLKSRHKFIQWQTWD